MLLEELLVLLRFPVRRKEIPATAQAKRHDGDGIDVARELRKVSELPGPAAGAVQHENGRTRPLQRRALEHVGAGPSTDHDGFVAVSRAGRWPEQRANRRGEAARGRRQPHLACGWREHRFDRHHGGRRRGLLYFTLMTRGAAPGGWRQIRSASVPTAGIPRDLAPIAQDLSVGDQLLAIDSGFPTQYPVRLDAPDPIGWRVHEVSASTPLTVPLSASWFGPASVVLSMITVKSRVLSPLI